MNTLDKAQKKEMKEKYQNRHPDKGIVCWRNIESIWIGMSRDIQASYNGIHFQLEMGSYPNRALQAAFNNNPDTLEWTVLELLDYKDPSEDYTDDLELLLMEVMDKYPEAKPITKRKFC